MEDRIQRVTDGLTELVKPYVGKRQYGGLILISEREDGKFPSKVKEKRIAWLLMYNSAFGGTSMMGADFLREEKVFKFSKYRNEKERLTQDYEEVITDDPEEVLAYFRTFIEDMIPRRRRTLKANARLKKEKGCSMEEAIAKVEEYARAAKNDGPTEEELELYRQFCKEVYSE